MPYPKEMLAPGETIVFEFGSHWSVLWQETLATIGYIWLLILLVPDGVNGWVFTILTLLWLGFAVRGFMEWRTVQHVVTNERFIVRSGLLRKVGYEFPLEVINDVAFRQNLIERALGVGDVMLETAGSNGQSRLANIPEPEKMKNLISETRRNRTHSVARGGPAPSAPPPAAAEHRAPSGKSSAEQLEILGRLFDEGKLTQDEYDSEKRKLLG
jgi:uncharacterized membrane protein YdbT with pleckstrin-like domain